MIQFFLNITITDYNIILTIYANDYIVEMNQLPKVPIYFCSYLKTLNLANFLMQHYPIYQFYYVL